jgi:hypothetical protein
VISCCVVGHADRIVEATDLARTLGAAVVMDDGTIGADANHLLAWAETARTETEWCAVLEDDALPVAGFVEQAELALAAAPADVVSFYLGKGRPVRWQYLIPGALEKADQGRAHWITTNHMLHAVAVAMRAPLRADWLAWADTSTLPIDDRLGAWCRSRRHSIAYTVPSLVEHSDLPTLVRHRDRRPRTKPRAAWRTGVREVWNSKAVAM